MDILVAVLSAFGGSGIGTLIVWLAWIRPEDKRIQARIEARRNGGN